MEVLTSSSALGAARFRVWEQLTVPYLNWSFIDKFVVRMDTPQAALVF